MIITGIPIKKLEKINLPTIHKVKGREKFLKQFYDFLIYISLKARWYTYAIWLLRLYVQEPNPSLELIKSVRFILKFHLCMSICVKTCPLIQGT